ncbi:hypothetical protein [Aquitalea palustris]|uniref:hypothetical protein n=1 Tax=Aquitalea palustris TaxID=2480983 RepID=UPI001CF06E1E|nr:hypothetical protein [Aquitalea palustris]
MQDSVQSLHKCIRSVPREVNEVHPFPEEKKEGKAKSNAHPPGFTDQCEVQTTSVFSCHFSLVKIVSDE